MLPWNGSDVKEIAPHITGALEQNGVWAIRIGNDFAHVHRYTDDLILLLDEYKSAFGMMKVGRHKATLNGRPIILSRILGEERYLTENDKDMAEDVRRCYLFRWICGLVRHGVKDMIVRSTEGSRYVVSYNEERIGKERTLEKTVLDAWFGTATNLRDPLSQILFGESYASLHSRLMNITTRVAPSLIFLVDIILQRLQEIGAFSSQSSY